MAMTINTNVVSINSQRNLSLSGNSLGTTMQRLSSGLRVNSAKDDAAGLAIAERMNALSKGLAVAARNANDGISLAQTTEGALGKVGDMLQRMRELAVQSSNATNSAADREALQAEVNQLRSEIDRVAKTTTFNGTKVLDGSFTGGVFQVGAGAGDNITVGATTKATADGLGNVEFGSSQSKVITASKIEDIDQVLKGAKINVGGKDYELGDIKAASSGEDRLGQLVSAINAKTADTGVTAFLEKGANAGEFQISMKSDSDKVVTLSGLDSLAAAATGASNIGTKNYTAENAKFMELTGSGFTALTDTTSAADATKVKNEILDATNALIAKMSGAAKTAAEGLRDTFNGLAAPAGATLTTAEADAFNNAVEALKGATATDGMQAQVTANDELQDAYTTAATVINGMDKDSSYDAVNAAATALIAAQTGMGQTASTAPALQSTSTKDEVLAALKTLQGDTDALGLNVSKAEVAEHKGITDLDISTQAGSWEAIKQIDSAIDQVNAARADLGALQTRFEKSIENIDIMNENITAARGRIVDADFATETANLSRAQILQQAGTAMVAQANQLPQQVLSLLQ